MNKKINKILGCIDFSAYLLAVLESVIETVFRHYPVPVVSVRATRIIGYSWGSQAECDLAIDL